MKSAGKNANLPDDFTWAPLTPELTVSDLDVSLAFWCGVIGFEVAYDRPEQKFAYLNLDGAQLMLEQRSENERQWMTGALEPPFGRGINFQIAVSDCRAVHARVVESGRVAYMNIEDKWYRAGEMEVGVRQFLVQDPDGYLVRLSSSIGQRPYKGDAKP